MEVLSSTESLLPFRWVIITTFLLDLGWVCAGHRNSGLCVESGGRTGLTLRSTWNGQAGWKGTVSPTLGTELYPPLQPTVWWSDWLACRNLQDQDPIKSRSCETRNQAIGCSLGHISRSGFQLLFLSLNLAWPMRPAHQHHA